MQSRIDEFYEYESSFIDWIDRGERYEEIKERIAALFSRFEETLTEDQKLMVKEVGILNHRMQVEAEKATYKAGFKTGMALACEALKR